jgi:hypothetical protein
MSNNILSIARGRMWWEAAVAYLELLARYWFQGTEQNNYLCGIAGFMAEIRSGHFYSRHTKGDE